MKQRQLFPTRLLLSLITLLCSTGAWAEDNIGAITWNANDNYYEIGTAAALEDLAVYVNGSGNYSTGGPETTPHNCAGLKFKLTANINMTGSHTPIGTTDAELGYAYADPINNNGKPFRGTFDGVTYTITGLSINQVDGDFLGLFGFVAGGAIIKNVTLNELNITGRAGVGGIVGCTQGSSTDSKVTIQDCRVNGSIYAAITSTEKYAGPHGGILGYSFDYTDITNCIVTGTISFSNPSNIGYQYFSDYGGICGTTKQNTNISSCQVTANITAGTMCGGIVGWNPDNETNSISNCFSAGDIQATTTSYGSKHCGAIVGTAYPYRYKDYNNYCSNVSNCYYYTTRDLKAFGDDDTSVDYTGRGERVYTITKGDQISTLTIAEDPTYTSPLTGLSYYKNVGSDNGWTVTLTPNWTNSYFVKFTCDGGTNSKITDETTIEGTHQIYGFSKNVVIDAEVYSSIGAMRWNNTDQCFEIGSKEALEDLAVFVNGKGTYSTGGEPNSIHQCEGMTFKLTQDITMTGKQNPIGGRFTTDYSIFDSQFKGDFDGGGHTITNLTIDHPNDYNQGLFGYVSEAGTIKNVKLVNCHITGKEYTGGIAGYVYGTSNDKRRVIQNCHVVNGTIDATQSGADSHGGIIGYVSSNTTIDGCSVSGTISTTEACSDYGGIVGKLYNNNCTVSNCENAASIKGSGDNHGGIIGIDSQYTTLTGCLNTGTVEGSSNCGAIVGYKSGYSSAFNYFSNNFYATPCNINNKPFGNYDNDRVDKGERAYRILAGDHITGITSANAVFISQLDGVKAYFKSGDITLTLTTVVPEGETFSGYYCEGIELSSATTIDGTHTMTMPKQDLVINANMSNSGAVDIAGAVIEAIAEQRWKGGASVIPTLTVTYQGTPLTLGTDYILVCTNNTSTTTTESKAMATVQGINGYTGSKSVTFDIADFPLQTSGSANSATNPYLVVDEADLQALACIVNRGVRNNGFYKQTKDITLEKAHTPIGIYKSNNDTYKFQGTYDGGDNKIEGMTISRSTTVYDDVESANIGLFGRTKNATIQNVNVVDCNLSAYMYLGGVVGYAENTTVNNCSVSGSITGYGRFGGIVGGLGGSTITYNTNNAIITGNFDIGGIVGDASGYSSTNKINNNNNHGSVSGDSFVGGIAGLAGGDYLYVKENFNTGEVTAVTERAGSIIGSFPTSSGPIKDIQNNYHIPGLTGGIGDGETNVGTDVPGEAEVVFTIAAGNGVSIAEPLPTVAKVYNEQNYYKNGTELTLSYTGPDYFNVYEVDNGEISNPGIIDGTHTLTGVTNNVTITGTNVAQKTDFSTTVAIAAIADLIYNGSAQHPEPEVKIGETTLVKNQDFSYSYSVGCENKGTYTVTVTGLGIYSGSKSVDYKINAYDIRNAFVTGYDRFYTSNGGTITPSPTVKRNGTTLSSTNDYDIAWSSGCQEPGDYYITLTGKGNYTGTRLVHFSIINDKLTVYGANNNYSYSVPLNGNYAKYYQKSEFIMPADQLEGMKDKAIRGMNFYFADSADDEWGNARFRVFLKEVTEATFTKIDYYYDFMGTEGATIVYEGALDGTQSKMFVPFDYPFVYHGGNLLIGCYEYQTGNGIYSVFYGDEASEGTCIWESTYSDSGSLEDITTGSNQGRMPKTTFWYESVPTSIDIAMNNLGIMTYASPYPLNFSNATTQTSNAKALTASYASAFSASTNNDNTGTLTLTPVTQVPAGEGLLLKGEADATYTVPVITTSVAALSPANLMVGLTAPTSVDKKQTINNVEYTSFILSKVGDNPVNWYVLKEDSYVLKANSAYLRLKSSDVYTSSGNARQIVMNYDEASGISDVVRDMRSSDDSWYTVDGVKLGQKPTRKGLYIVNGVKVAIK